MRKLSDGIESIRDSRLNTVNRGKQQCRMLSRMKLFGLMPALNFFFITHIEMMSVMFIPRRPNKSTHVDEDEDDEDET